MRLSRAINFEKIAFFSPRTKLVVCEAELHAHKISICFRFFLLRKRRNIRDLLAERRAYVFNGKRQSKLRFVLM